MSASSVVLAREAPARARRWTGGLSLSGFATLAAVTAVLVVVSVPHLHGLALQENEADARATAQLLARALAEPRREPVGDLAALLAGPGLRGLDDVELLASGTLLRRHGYLYALTTLAAGFGRDADGPAGAGTATRPRLAVCAWPWLHGRTGQSAFLVASDGAAWRHANTPPRWEGLAAAGLSGDGASGWLPAR